ncbi:MAG: hypothetical protein A2845_03650 [Candidatus Lloydbacteria bacterium RIFCSPHIGHO2_01_FULL_49_22]|uniref:Uncharacterized protein n=1 Tax=Candidatus Lloydbacteria bacterium RIFCSPHIGHO2_01_FULL_49_22 TaxID=1798658 RepID=A0A1G2CZ03_9BACT|nr:MAG: hypothetical protein A2845_03650 [Candidatus Lloydbacteria bacterium RIFCSPHIGHO2_01_FULL_49_22]OGZ09024.1 MAG: hypothetical protein A3C14_03485 [Candidatus Lloydbacteria bacterium RIFCSPHIGHO2_02_FULL_50_18]
MNIKSLFFSLLLVTPAIIFAAPTAEPCRFELSASAQKFELQMPDGHGTLLTTETMEWVSYYFEILDKASGEKKISQEEYVAREKTACLVDFLALGFTEPERCKKYK